MKKIFGDKIRDLKFFRFDFFEFDKKKFFEDISNQKVKDELKSLTDKAFQNDVFGAPTFIVNNKLFWGQDRLEYALEEFSVN